MQCKPIYEFLAWDNCNNNCEFCFQRELPRLFAHKKRKEILDEILLFLNSDKFVKGSHILLVGGEIFDKPIDFKIVENFYTCVINKMLQNEIDLLYINTNLIYKNVAGLFAVLLKLCDNNLMNRVRFTTSYDIQGRFKTDDDRQLMLNNLKYIKKHFPDCQIVTNMILTEPLCKQLINQKLKPAEFMRDYDCWINFIPYIIYKKELSATKEEIFKSLIKIEEACPGYIERYITNLDLNQDKLLYIYKNNKFEFGSCENASCGHSVNFNKYSQSKTCFVCDLKEVFNVYK